MDSAARRYIYSLYARDLIIRNAIGDNPEEGENENCINQMAIAFKDLRLKLGISGEKIASEWFNMTNSFSRGAMIQTQ